MKRKIRVYVAGPYSADNVIDVLRNIGRGIHTCSLLFDRGFAPFCPWADRDFVIYNWMENQDSQQFRDYSMAWLEVSDCIFLVKDYSGMVRVEDSPGTQAEARRAKELGIPVFSSMDELERFSVSMEKRLSV